MIPGDAATHVALSVQNEGSGKRVRLFVDGIETGSVVVPAYFLPTDAPLFIGVGNRVANPLDPPNPAWPMVSAVQEVVLHNKALSQQEIENHATFK
jgi:hypothetical protein